MGGRCAKLDLSRSTSAHHDRGTARTRPTASRDPAPWRSRSASNRYRRTDCPPRDFDSWHRDRTVRPGFSMTACARAGVANAAAATAAAPINAIFMLVSLIVGGLVSPSTSERGSNPASILCLRTRYGRFTRCTHSKDLVAAHHSAAYLPEEAPRRRRP